MASVFTTQSYLKQKGAKKANMDYSVDNLFAGVWRLDQSNLDRFDPFIGGYAFFMWTKLPQFFEADMKSQFQNATEKNFKAFSGVSDMTLATEDMTMGFAGNTLGVATNMQKENTNFTMTHYEMAGSPMRELYHYWITGIRDPETGLAHYHGKVDTISGGYSMKNHSAELLYVVTDPSGSSKGIEAAFYYTNVIPLKIPQDHLNYSAGDHSIPEIQIDFKGNQHQSKEINELAVQAMQKYKVSKQFGDYGLNKPGIKSTGYDEKSGY